MDRINKGMAGTCLMEKAVADYLAAKFSIEQIPPRILAWIQAAVYWLIAVLFVCS